MTEYIIKLFNTVVYNLFLCQYFLCTIHIGSSFFWGVDVTCLLKFSMFRRQEEIANANSYNQFVLLSIRIAFAKIQKYKKISVMSKFYLFFFYKTLKKEYI